MSMSTTTRRLSFAGALTASALGLAALTTPLSPAKAQVLGFDFGPFSFGIGAPAPGYYYPPAYPYSYYAPNYYQGYYPGYYPRYYYYPRW